MRRVSERSFEEAIDCGNVCSNTPRRLCGRGDPLARGSLSPTITTRSTPQERGQPLHLIQALSDGRFSRSRRNAAYLSFRGGPARSVSLARAELRAFASGELAQTSRRPGPTPFRTRPGKASSGRGLLPVGLTANRGVGWRPPFSSPCQEAWSMRALGRITRGPTGLPSPNDQRFSGGAQRRAPEARIAGASPLGDRAHRWLKSST